MNIHARYHHAPCRTLLAGVLAMVVQTGVAQPLPALLGRVLERDPQVRVAQALSKVADARMRQMRSRLWPSLGLSANSGEGHDFDSGVLVDRHTERSELSLRWNLYNAGNDSAELKAAVAERDGALAEVVVARTEVAERIADAYRELWRTKALLVLANARFEAVQRLVSLVQKQAVEGKASKVDLQQAQSSQVDSEITVEQLRAEHLSARYRMMKLVGEDVEVTESLVVSTDGGESSEPGAALRAARLRAMAARMRVRPVETLAAPRVDFDMRRRLSNKTRPRLTTVQHDSWVAELRWDVPLGGEAAARLDEMAHRADAAQAEVERIEQEMAAERTALIPRIAAAEHAVKMTTVQVERFFALVRAGEIQFEAGRRSVQQLIELRNSLFASQQRLSEQGDLHVRSQLRLAFLEGRLLTALGCGVCCGQSALCSSGSEDNLTEKAPDGQDAMTVETTVTTRAVGPLQSAKTAFGRTHSKVDRPSLEKASERIR